MKLTREDFYCGAFLSYLLNNGIVPALFEDRKDLNRKVYDFTTDKGDFRVYVKCSENPSSESDTHNSAIWNFPFTESQIDEIKSLIYERKQFYFAFVCGRSELNKSRIAVVPDSIVLQCIDINRTSKYKSQSVKVKLAKGEWNFSIYGTARADKDKATGQDTTFKVRVKNIDDLFAKDNSA
ncbi:hypothetical protein ACFSO0_03490 [Brevibacillus sp. GCM10020057]|uniref:hypothetical protein n=1 Tax=Brevibacillus sp. GCM10020057 TaxID=3317327 RepID=UPI0036334111